MRSHSEDAERHPRADCVVAVVSVSQRAAVTTGPERVACCVLRVAVAVVVACRGRSRRCVPRSQSSLRVAVAVVVADPGAWAAQLGSGTGLPAKTQGA